MLSDAEITAAASRLVSNKLSLKDVDTLVAAFRTILGGLEVRDNMNLVSTLEALDDTGASSRSKAAKMAAVVVRLQGEDFGVANITQGIRNSDEDQRNLFLIYAISELYTLPTELAYQEDFIKVGAVNKRSSNKMNVTYVP
jgi:hypothetical protein